MVGKGIGRLGLRARTRAREDSRLLACREYGTSSCSATYVCGPHRASLRRPNRRRPFLERRPLWYPT